MRGQAVPDPPLPTPGLFAMDFASMEPVAQFSCAVVGLMVLRATLSAVMSVYTFMLRPGKNLKKYGKWAVVTGATDGIGEAMAMEMAKKGMSIVLVSRTESKLKDTQEKILAKCPKVEVEYVSVDYSNFDAKAQEKVKQCIADKDVGILLNNVGVSYSFARYFHELSAAEVDNMVELNVNSTTRMTYLVLPGMLERKRGSIINVSSAAARNPSPLLAEYAGSKGFVEHFSESMYHELKGKGIHVQVQSPLFVVSKLSKIRKSSLSTPKPAAYAKAAVAHIGYQAKVSPYWAHAFQLWVVRNLPEWLFIGMIAMPMHQTIRKKGFKKMEREGKKA